MLNACIAPLSKTKQHFFFWLSPLLVLLFDLLPNTFSFTDAKVSRDQTKAMELYAKAAAQGHAKADYHLKNLRDQELWEFLFKINNATERIRSQKLERNR